MPYLKKLTKKENHPHEKENQPYEIDIKMHNPWVLGTWGAAVFAVAATTFMIYISTKPERFTNEWWKSKGIAALALLMFLYFIHDVITNKQLYYRLRCHNNLLTLWYKQAETLTFTTHELSGVRFIPRTRKGEVIYYKMTFFDLWGSEMVTLHLRRKHLKLMIAYLEQHEVKIEENSFKGLGVRF